MKVLRKLVVAVAATAVVVAFATARPAHAQSPAANPAHGLVGVWTLNQDLSDKPPSGIVLPEAHGTPSASQRGRKLTSAGP